MNFNLKFGVIYELDARIAISKFSPLNDTLDVSVKSVTEGNISELVSKLLDCMRTGVGLATKVGTARYLTSLCVSKPQLMKKFSGKLATASVSHSLSSSPGVRKGYSNVLIALAPLLSSAQLRSVVTTLSSKYLSSMNVIHYNYVDLTFQEEELKYGIAFTLRGLLSKGPSLGDNSSTGNKISSGKSVESGVPKELVLVILLGYCEPVTRIQEVPLSFLLTIFRYLVIFITNNGSKEQEKQ